VDQTPETRKLVLPENRNRRKEIGEKLEDPPCESCWKKSLRCKLNTPGHSRCGYCITRSLVCNWNHPSDPSARFTRGKPKISLDQKCVRCFTRHLTCDGKTPCDKCNTPRLRKKCVSQVEWARQRDVPKCNNCGTTSNQCDKGRPYSSCVGRGRNCVYTAQNGLLLRTYEVPEAPKIQGFAKPLGEGEKSDEECERCQNLRFTCDGGQPYYKCVKDRDYPVTTCRYRKTDGAHESYATRPYTLNELGEVGLRSDWEQYVGGRKKGSRKAEGLKKLDKRKGEQKLEEPAQKDLSTTESDSSDALPERLTHSTLSKLRDFRHNPKTAMLANIDQPRFPDPNSYKEAMNSPEAPLWKQSVREEITSLEKKHSWDVVPLPEGVKPITSRLVFKRKYGPDGKVNRRKARLVARGFQQEEGRDYDETFAAVVKAASYRILFTLTAILGWGTHQVDAKTAFLNGILEKPLYMRLPQGMKLSSGLVLLVLRALYGLN
jgi:hypothetical protein